MLRVIEPRDVPRRRRAFSRESRAQAAAIVDRVRAGGLPELELCAREFDGCSDPVRALEPEDLDAARRRLDPETASLLERTARRIESFARDQRNALRDVTVERDGLAMGHRAFPLATAGCYVPGGRYPLPSSALMTVIPARVAGVSRVTVATPNPNDTVLAAAAIAGADSVLPVGGAHAIAALAYGVAGPACDIVVGPGGEFVTAAKAIVSEDVRIDMLAGPSELAILADASANPTTVAADLIAQAEHDPLALPILITDVPHVIERTQVALEHALLDLPTRDTAIAAVRRGFAVRTRDLTESIAVSERIAAEHVELMLADAATVAPLLTKYGALFIGSTAAEVLGDYGVGPNHTLPTGGTPSQRGGLSVLDFLRLPTWVEVRDPAAAQGAVQDATEFAREEGLEGHARSAEKRGIDALAP
ncbi:MAG: histidinol dehydrogenase [Planctomycetota bacterium]